MATLTVAGLARRFGALAALDDAGLTARPGEILGLLGPNGAGKTTLLQCVAGLLAPDAGTVRWDDRPLPPGARRDVLLFLPDGIAPWEAQPAGWLLDFTRALYGAGDPALHADVHATLRLDELRDRPVGQLSKGQRKRVLVAAALLAPHPVLLFDEPFDGLDLRLTRDAIALFRRVAARGRALVVSIHGMADAARLCDRLVLLQDGRTVAEGTLAELRSRAALPDGDLEEVFLALA